MRDGLAIFVPSLRAFPRSDGTVVITKKFHDGVLRNLEEWDGPIRVLMERSSGETANLDNIPVSPAALPYELRILETFRDDRAVATHLQGASVVLGTIGWEQSKLSRLCNDLEVASLYCTEYTLKTRLQIVRADHENQVQRTRKFVFEMNQERRNQMALRIATGVQCNGTPTYEVYRWLNRSPHLYFDNRIAGDAQIGQEALERRLGQLDEGRPLRLAFSGRLDPMKGAHHLPAVAEALRQKGVDFQLSICGGGRLAEQIEQDVRRLGLEDRVRMRGVLSFDRELVPFMKQDVDLFVCPHVQGDPSCTYVETFGCGVPMVGFDNEAFAGIVRRSSVGRAVPLGDVPALAGQIAHLDRNREELKRCARTALAFARRHTFERMVKGRVEHMRGCIEEAGRTFSMTQFVGRQLARFV